MKKTLLVIVVLIIALVAIYFFSKNSAAPADVNQEQPAATTTAPAAPVAATNPGVETIGQSVGGRSILAYHYGNTASASSTEILFVGGIHGGYEWNTALVAYQAMAYFASSSDVIPANVKVTVIPVLNPDGLSKVVGTTTAIFSASDVAPSQETQVAGRFNANTVDLNRNFDCDWQANGVWQSKTVSGGTAAFSEPESQALKAYVEGHKIAAAVVWYSSAGGVFSSSCHNGVSADTAALTKAFAAASGYPAHEDFNFYEITGDAVNWMAKKSIPAISILLTNHTDTEWTKNRAGIDAVLKAYAK